jgi:hypothetical protein
MFIYDLIFSSIFVVFLPLVHKRFSDKESAIQKLKVLYSIKLVGFAAGFVIVGMRLKEVSLIMEMESDNATKKFHYFASRFPSCS